MAPPTTKMKKKMMKRKKKKKTPKSRSNAQLNKKLTKPTTKKKSDANAHANGFQPQSHSEKLLVEPGSASDFDWWHSFSQRASAAASSASQVPSDVDEAFKYFFRVSIKSFDYICSLVREDLISRPPSGLINIEGRLLSVEKQVAIALRRLASGESQVSVGGAFGVGQSTVSQVTWRFIESMEERGRQHLKWPSAKRMDEIKANFETTFGLPNCCGSIDATHIIMTLPAVETSDDWCDQASNYSMFLQAIVDEQMRFLDIATGWPGRMTVTRLLKCSGFYRQCESGDRLNGSTKVLPQGAEIREYIVGSVAYPLLPWLVTPFVGKDLSDVMNCFNFKHRGARSLAERSLAQLKGSWRILHKVMWRPDKNKLPSIILVCCLLHNILIDNGDKLNSDVPLPDHHDAGYGIQSCQHVSPEGIVIRDNLLKYFSEDPCLYCPA